MILAGVVGRTLNAIIIAFDASASFTSPSVTAPALPWITLITTFSVLSFSSDSLNASTDPFESALLILETSFPVKYVFSCSARLPFSL